MREIARNLEKNKFTYRKITYLLLKCDSSHLRGEIPWRNEQLTPPLRYKPRYNVLLSFPEVVRSCGSLSCNVCGTLREVYAFSRRIRGSSWMETSFFLTNYIEEQFWGAFRWVEIVLELYIVYSLHDVNCLWKGFKSCLEMIPELSILLRILKIC